MGLTNTQIDKLNKVSYSTRSVGLGTKVDSILTALQGAPTITVGTESGDNIDVTVQMNDLLGDTLAGVQRVDFTVSDAAGGAPTVDSPSGGVTATTGTLYGFASGASYLEVTPDTSGWIHTDANGVAVIRFNEAGVDTFYLNLFVQGKLHSSGAITFA